MKFTIYLFAFFILFSANTFAQDEVTDTIIPNTEINSDWLTIDTTDYSLSYPDTWERQEPSRDMIEFTLTKNDLTLDNIGLAKEKFKKQNYSLKRYSEIGLRNLESSFKSFKLLSKENTTLNGMDCIKIIFLTKIGKVKFQFVQYIFVKNRSAYILNFTSSKKNFPINVLKANEVINTFILK